jgi:hypothetical protein
MHRNAPEIENAPGKEYSFILYVYINKYRQRIKSKFISQFFGYPHPVKKSWLHP